MKIEAFISDFNSKRISADPKLPKYQELVKRDIRKSFTKKKEEIETNGLAAKPEPPSDPVKALEEAQDKLADSIIETMESTKIAVGSDVPPHVETVIDTEYTTILKLLQDKDIQGFNDIIGTYLRRESGYGIDLAVRGDRPGSSSVTFNPSLVEGDMANWVNFEDQIMFEGLDKEKLKKSRPGWIDRLFGLFSNSYHDKIYVQQSKSLIGQGWRATKKKEEQELVEFTIEDFFSQVKIKVGEAEKFKTHIKTIFTQIENAKNMGQVALLENLASKLVVEVYEAALMSLGYNKYITFEDLRKLEKKSPRGLSIDQIPNFTRIIPQDVVEEKKKADDLQIFDQYVILHFDPEKKAVKETVAEVESKKAYERETRAKDPILFGLILDSQKLYYIADWVDELCDLTWDKAIEILGDKEEDHLLKIKEK